MQDYGARIRESWPELRKRNVCIEGSNDATSLKIEKYKEPATNRPKLADIAGYLKEYCNCCGVHGVRYLTEERRNLFEKLFWVTAIVICAIGCSLMIIKIKNKVDTTPVIVTFAESPTNIWHLPFPAVTLCPLTKCLQTVFNSAKYMKLLNSNDDLYDDYKMWVEYIYFKSLKHLYYKNITGDFRSNDYVSTYYIEQLFEHHVRPHMYGDVISKELTSLLEEIFLFTTNQLLRLSSDDVFNHTVVEQTFTDLCNNSVFRKSMDEYFPNWHNETILKVWALHSVCKADPFDLDIMRAIVTIFFNETLFAEDDTIPFLMKVADTLEKNTVTWDASYQYEYSFYDLFKRTLTEEGVCFTFNMLNKNQIYSDQIKRETLPHYRFEHNKHHDESPFSNDWNPDTGYSTSGLNPYPRRALGVGKSVGLTMQLEQNQNDVDYQCNPGGATGYKIILHRPEDHPSLSLNFVVQVPFLKDVSILINPFLMTTSPDLKDYEPHKRQCYYSSENHLEYFKFYSKNNCELECLTKAILKRCGCVPFYMPRKNSTRICGVGSESCVDDTSKEIEKRQIREDLVELSKNGRATFGSTTSQTECDCLPSCVSISYTADVTTVDLDTKKYSENNDNNYYTIINVFYKDKQFISTERSERYGQIDFLANCGGLLGLFSGFSILSLIELVYFFTLRLCTNTYRRWKASSKPPKRTSRQINVHYVGNSKDPSQGTSFWELDPSLRNQDGKTFLCQKCGTKRRTTEEAYFKSLRHKFPV